MDNHGVKFIRDSVPSNVEATEDGKRKVTWTNASSKTTYERVFDTVMLAVGRTADTMNLVEGVGIQLAPSGKILAQNDDRTTVHNIFAIGDVVEGRLELTPSAIKAGRLLAQRLFNNGT